MSILRPETLTDCRNSSGLNVEPLLVWGLKYRIPEFVLKYKVPSSVRRGLPSFILRFSPMLL